MNKKFHKFSLNSSKCSVNCEACCNYWLGRKRHICVEHALNGFLKPGADLGFS